MLSTVDLDDELRFSTEEIDDIRPHRMLAAKAEALKLPASQARPEADLRIGRESAQSPCDR
jgi:hypothetical protein